MIMLKIGGFDYDGSINKRSGKENVMWLKCKNNKQISYRTPITNSLFSSHFIKKLINNIGFNK